MTKYTVIEKEKFGEVDSIIERLNEDGSLTYIPADPANSDYQRYLRWLENPNADESGKL